MGGDFEKENDLSFLNPLILYALAAVAIPFLIHLLNRRKIKRISFSTIQFLKRLEKKQMRNLRIRQILLLIIRTAIILLLVTAFARPTLDSSGGGLISERGPIEAVILLDNSLSLNEARLTGSLLENLRQNFSALEPVFQSGDRISIIQTGKPQQIIIKQENYEATVWERVRQKLQPNYLKSDLDNGLATALDLLKNSVYSSREIYVLSDFQKSALQSNQFANLLEQPDFQNIKIFNIPIFHENLENISIDSVEVVNRLIEINQQLRIKTYLHNHHPQKNITTLASVILNGNRVGQQQVSIPPGQQKEVLFQVTLTENGFVQGRVETESDALQEDNRRYFNFYVPNKIKTLHIIPAADFESFIPLIIQPANQRGIFDYHSEVIANWSSRNFMDYDMLIVEGLNQLPETFVLRLKSFIERGGGALVIPGEKIVTPQYARFFDNFSIGKLAELRGNPNSKDQFLTLKDVEWKHPIFEGLFENPLSKINPIEVYASYRIRPARNTENLLNLSDRSPLLLQSNKDKGTLFFLTTPLSPAWSQLPIKGFVVPLIYRMVYYAGTRKIKDRQSVRCGEIFQQQFSNLEAPFDFKMVGRSDTDVRLSPRFRGSNIFLEMRETEIPGNYRLLNNANTLGVLSVNPWKEESQMDFYSAEDLQTILPNSNFLNATDNLVEAVRNNRFGKELWKYFLIAAFIFLIIEMIVARTGAKQETLIEQ